MLSRRTLFLAGAGAAFASDPAKFAVYASDAKRYNDAVTEFPVIRLTSPQYTSVLPAYYNRAVAGKGFTLLSSDRGGKMDVYRLDIRGGEMRQLTDLSRLLPASVVLLPGDRAFLCADANSVRQVSIANQRSHDLYRAGGEIVALSASDDGTHAAVVENASGKYRLSLVHLGNGTPRVLLESADPISDPIHRPQRDSVLYRRGPASLWLANNDGQLNYRLKIATDATGTPQWSPDGRSVLYLSIPSDPAQKNQLREFIPDSNEDKLIAATTRFVDFRTNSDASVFVGASGSKAAPHVLLLLRSVKREFTLCEHRAGDPASVAPVFSSNSQRVFFNSDQHGKPAVYMMDVARLVEET